MYFMHNIVCIKSLYEKIGKFILENSFIENIHAFVMRTYEPKWLIAICPKGRAFGLTEI